LWYAAGGDMGMCWAQHLSKVQYNDEDDPRREVLASAIWSNLYTSVIADAQTIANITEEDSNLKSISLILPGKWIFKY
jgi:hypothetical protein